MLFPAIEIFLTCFCIINRIIIALWIIVFLPTFQLLNFFKVFLCSLFPLFCILLNGASTSTPQYEDRKAIGKSESG